MTPRSVVGQPPKGSLLVLRQCECQLFAFPFLCPDTQAREAAKQQLREHITSNQRRAVKTIDLTLRKVRQ